MQYPAIKILLLLSIPVFVRAQIPFNIDTKFASGSAAPEGNGMILDAIRVLGLNIENRIVVNGVIRVQKPIGQATKEGGQFADAFSQQIRGNGVTDWKVLFYIRKTGMEEDNQIFYGYQDSLLHLSQMLPTSPDTTYPFYKTPFVIDEIKLTVDGKTTMTYKIADTVDPATWIANHGIYVADVDSQTMQNVYYDPYDMAYFF